MTQEMKTDLLNEIRSRIERPGKVPSWISTLDDANLWSVFVLIRQGADSTEVSRHLISKNLWSGTPDAGRKLIAKFKKKILPLLFQPSPREPSPVVEKKEPPPVDTGNGKGSTTVTVPVIAEQIVEGMDELQQINQLCARYRSVIDRELAEAEQGGALSQTLSRHVQALNQLLKTRLKLQNEQEKKDRSWSPTLSPQEKRQFQSMVDSLQDGGKVMLAATRTFLRLAEAEAIELPSQDTMIHKKSGPYN